MEEKRFHREDYPLDILAKFGLMEEMIYDLPEFVHETLERGGKSPLLPICVEQPFGVTHASAKFCLIETEEDLDVMFSPKLKSINLDAFSEEERQALLAGKVIVAEVEDKAVTDEGVEEMQRIQAFVQLDRDTNEGVSKFRYSLSSNYSKLFRVVYKGSLTHAEHLLSDAETPETPINQVIFRSLQSSVFQASNKFATNLSKTGVSDLISGTKIVIFGEF